MKHLALAFVIIFAFANLNAQNISGNWYGIGKANLDASTNSYLTELNIIQKGKNITGELNFYFRDSLFINKVTGTFDQQTRILHLSNINFIFCKSSDTKTGVECPMKGEFMLRVARTESVFTGYFFPDKNYSFTCPEINFKLKKFTGKENEETEISIKDTAKTEKPKQDTVTKPQPVVEDNQPVKPKPKTKDVIDKEKEFSDREKTYVKEIYVTNNKLLLEFYDNGAIDYDSISVFLNNNLVLEKSKLEHKAIKLTIQLDENLPFNELSMFAESLGMIPPNTAALIIFDGTKRYDLILSSDFHKSSTIKLIKKKTD